MYSFGNKQQNAAIVIVEMKSMANSSLVLEKKIQEGGFPGGSVAKNPANVGNMSLIPGPRKIPHAMEQISSYMCTQLLSHV